MNLLGRRRLCELSHLEREDNISHLTRIIIPRSVYNIVFRFADPELICTQHTGSESKRQVNPDPNLFPEKEPSSDLKFIPIFKVVKKSPYTYLRYYQFIVTLVKGLRDFGS